MNDPKKSTISSSELSALLLGSSTALPTTGNTAATKEWAEVGGKTRPSGSTAQSWERSGRGLNTVEASQILKQQALGAHSSKAPSLVTARHRKIETKGGREGVVPNYHLLLHDLSKRVDTSRNDTLQGKDEKHEGIEEHLSTAKGTADAGLEVAYDSSDDDHKRERSLLGKRPRSDSNSSDGSTSSSDDDSSVSTPLMKTVVQRMQEDDSSSDEADARRHRARSKAIQRRAETVVEGSQVGTRSDDHVEDNNHHRSYKESPRKLAESSESDDDQSQTSDSDDSSDSDSSSSSTSNDETTLHVMVGQSSKPIFVPKSQRLSAAENRRKEKGEQSSDIFRMHQMIFFSHSLRFSVMY